MTAYTASVNYLIQGQGVARAPATRNIGTIAAIAGAIGFAGTAALTLTDTGRSLEGYLASKPQTIQVQTQKSKAKRVETSSHKGRGLESHANSAYTSQVQQVQAQGPVDYSNVDYLSGIIQAPSPNFRDVKNRRYEFLVLHTTASESGSALNAMRNPAHVSSAHFLVAENGQIYQLVPTSKVAEHVKPVKGVGYNSRSIGIEMAGWPDKPITQAQEEAAVQLSTWLCNHYKISGDRIKGHMELDPGRKPDPGQENLGRVRGRIVRNLGSKVSAIDQYLNSLPLRFSTDLSSKPLRVAA